MTMPASYAKLVGDGLPTNDDKVAANHLRQILAAQMSSGEKARLALADEHGETSEVILTPPLAGLLMELLRHVGRGDAVTLVPVGQMLTTQQAADLLNVSRPFLIGLLEKGKIQFEMVGRHRRVRAADLFRYKRDRDERRSRSLTELARSDADLI